MDKNLGLGKGLSALMGEDVVVLEQNVEQTPTALMDKIVMVMLNSLVPSPFQPRRVFDENALNDLVESIREKGVLQPLLVRPNPQKKGGYEIIAGERRFRAVSPANLQPEFREAGQRRGSRPLESYGKGHHRAGQVHLAV